MTQKKIPMRQCLGCREMKPKRELIRVVRSPEGVISLDFRGKASGRGAYVCKNGECLKKAVRSKALERAFGDKLSVSVYTAVENCDVDTLFDSAAQDGAQVIFATTPSLIAACRKAWNERHA